MTCQRGADFVVRVAREGLMRWGIGIGQEERDQGARQASGRRAFQVEQEPKS